jgi:YfiH family protein
MPPLPLDDENFFCGIRSDVEGIEYFFSPGGKGLEKIREPLCRVKQVHGSGLRVVEPKDRQELSGTDDARDPNDGLLTDLPGLFLTVTSADCLPFLFFDPGKKAIAAVHAGWRGSFLDICGAAVRKMTERFRSDPREIRTVCGPSIHACCFEIRQDVAGLFYEKYPGWKDLLSTRGEKMTLDLHGLNRRQLAAQGVSEAHIQISPVCTYCNPFRLPSYRRDGAQAGRLISGILLKHGKA